jgi:hypothetical protein
MFYLCGTMLRLAAILACISALGCGAGGPGTFPVRGSVRINGQPAGLCRVQFFASDAGAKGNLRTPMGMTDENGEFELVVDSEVRGALPGEYTVVFEWMSDRELGNFDRLGGAFADPTKSKIKAVIEAKDNALAPFELTIDPKKLVVKPQGKP